MHTPVNGETPKPRSLGPLRRMAMVVLAIAAIVFASGCAPDVKALPLDADGNPDPVHVQGEAVWVAHCTTCHGATGNGGSGPKLADGKVTEKYPEFGVQLSIVTNGVGGRMPAFKEKLTPAEIQAVARYTREVL